MNSALNGEIGAAIAGAMGLVAGVKETTLEAVIEEGLVPSTLKWAPTACFQAGTERLLLHLLETQVVPTIVIDAAKKLRESGATGTYVIVLASEVAEEATDGIRVVPAAWAAGNVAEECVANGIGLFFLESNQPVMVFPPGYKRPDQCECAEETGHIPKWLYERAATSGFTSPYLQGVFAKFARKYAKATRAKKVDFDTEVRLLTRLAQDIADGDPRLFIPVGQLDVLREFERQGSNKKARDHFFHTFNNLLMGYYILGTLKKGDELRADVDEFIEPENQRERQRKKLDEWEALWLLTCLFHDPAYIAENFHSGTFRFSYGIFEDESGFGVEIQEAQKEKIADLWQTEFVSPREWLSGLYARVIRKWKPPGGPSPKKLDFETALTAAYFDGRQVSHSLVSGIKLIQLCRHDKVTQQKKSQTTAETACTIAALSMMFHDQRCRKVLRQHGVPPFGFQKLPYAAVLMFVDCLQDDRRDIAKPRFRQHGVLSDLTVVSRTVKAEVCLPEMELRLWSGHIAEYLDVLNWVNVVPGVKFAIDYKTRAHLP